MAEQAAFGAGEFIVVGRGIEEPMDLGRGVGVRAGLRDHPGFRRIHAPKDTAREQGASSQRSGKHERDGWIRAHFETHPCRQANSERTGKQQGHGGSEHPPGLAEQDAMSVSVVRDGGFEVHLFGVVEAALAYGAIAVEGAHARAHTVSKFGRELLDARQHGVVD